MFGRLLLACILALVVSSSVLADWEPGDPEFPNPNELGDRLWWIPLSEYGAQNPGAEPLVRALPEQSNPNQTTVEIELHGFFVRANRSRDGQFDKKFLELSLGSIRESTTQAIGRPAMPQINVMLGIAPDGTVDLNYAGGARDCAVHQRADRTRAAGRNRVSQRRELPRRVSNGR